MTRYTRHDLERLGPSARAQIDNYRFALKEAERIRVANANKFGAKPYVGPDGKRHDSGVEGRRWEELKILQRSGRITNLIHQPWFDLHVGGVLVCRYRADASYYTDDGVYVVEDVKGGRGGKGGTRTPAYRIKRMLMKAIHGINITEVER